MALGQAVTSFAWSGAVAAGDFAASHDVWFAKALPAAGAYDDAISGSLTDAISNGSADMSVARTSGAFSSTWYLTDMIAGFQIWTGSDAAGPKCSGPSTAKTQRPRAAEILLTQRPRRPKAPSATANHAKSQGLEVPTRPKTPPSAAALMLFFAG
jgi:hypothetical protein